MRSLLLLLACVIAAPSFAADKYQPAPLQLLTERVDEHDQRLAEIDQRVAALERSEPVAAPQKPVTVAYTKPSLQSQPQERRLKTTAELQRDLRANWTSTLYADVKPRSWAKRHLVNDHGYQPSQVNGLSQDESWMLHNLAHNSARRINAYTAGASRPAVRSEQPAMVFAERESGCPNGQCATQRTQSTRRSSGWRPGSILFGR